MKYEFSYATAACIAPFPERTDVHWVTTSLQLRNALEGTAEQHELVYEVSWVEELRTWRRFLTSRRKVN
jgi:hypothetical protein